MHSAVRDNLLCLSNVYTSLWKASEWGMCGLQGTFIRCKKHLPLDKDKCRHLSVLFWCTMFKQKLLAITPKQVINIHGYNSICQYYLQPGNYEIDDEAELMEENFGNKVENKDGFNYHKELTSFERSLISNINKFQFPTCHC